MPMPSSGRVTLRDACQACMRAFLSMRECNVYQQSQPSRPLNDHSTDPRPYHT